MAKNTTTKTAAAPQGASTEEVTILRTQEAVEACDNMKQIVESFRAYGGNVPPSGRIASNMALAKTRLKAAIMNAQEMNAHTGVPKDTEPKALTNEELQAKGEEKGMAPEDIPQGVAEPDGPVAPSSTVFPQGTLAADLQEKAGEAKPIEKREPKADKKEKPEGTGKKRVTIYAVVCTFAGRSKLQADSVRNNVYLHIRNAANRARTIEELDKHFQMDTKGYIGKLLDRDHLKIVTKEEFEALPANVPLPPEATTPPAPPPAPAPAPAPATEPDETQPQA